MSPIWVVAEAQGRGDIRLALLERGTDVLMRLREVVFEVGDAFFHRLRKTAAAVFHDAFDAVGRAGDALLDQAAIALKRAGNAFGLRTEHGLQPLVAAGKCVFKRESRRFQSLSDACGRKRQ